MYYFWEEIQVGLFSFREWKRIKVNKEGNERVRVRWASEMEKGFAPLEQHILVTPRYFVLLNKYVQWLVEVKFCV